MQTFDANGNLAIFTCCPVMPGLAAITGFNDREDIYPSGITATLFQNRLNTVFLAKFLDFANEFCFDFVLSGHPLGIVTKFFSESIRHFIGVIKDLYLLSIQERVHNFSKAPGMACPSQDNSIITRKNSSNLFFVLFSNKLFSSVHGQSYPIFYNAMDQVFTYFLVPAGPG
jgi:hypothetical protein